MPDNRGIYFENINEKFSVLEYSVEGECKFNANNRAVFAEDFYVEFINELYGWHLKNANRICYNEGGVDLVFEDEETIIQISKRKDKRKIQESLDRINHEKYAGYHLYYIIIGKRSKRQHTDFKVPFGIVFQAEKDIWDNVSIMNEVGRVSTKRMRKLSEIVDEFYARQGDEKKKNNIQKVLKCLLDTCEERRKQYNDYKLPEFYEELLAQVEVEENGKEYNNLSEAVYDVTMQLENTDPIMLTAQGGQGKSTQMMLLWKYLEEHKNSKGKRDCYVLYFNLYALHEEGDILYEALKKYDVATEDIDTVVQDIRKPIRETGRHYFLLLDGLDEIQTDAPVIQRIKAFAENNTRVQIIIAGRSNSLFFERNTINMVLKDLKPDMVKRWLSNHYPDRYIEGDCEYINGNPMLLILAYKVDYNFPCHDKSPQYAQRNPDYPFRHGDVIWNYSEYILRKYCGQVGRTKQEIDNAEYFMYTVLPYIAYKYCYTVVQTNEIRRTDFETALVELAEKYTSYTYMNTISINDADVIIKRTFSGLIHNNGKCYEFNHRFFRDFFVMLYICNLIKKLYQKRELAKEEIKAITDNRILENHEYSDILLCTLPFVFKCFSTGYERDFLDLIYTYIIQQGESNQNKINIQLFKFIYATYHLVNARYYMSNSLNYDCSQMSRMAWETHDAMVEVASIPDRNYTELMPDDCFSYTYYILSQIYRTGSLFMSKLNRSKLKGFTPNLNKSFDYTFTAITRWSNSSDVSDGYNYLGKIFIAASEKIMSHFFRSSDDYVITDNDLLISFRDYRIDNYCFADHISEDIAKATKEKPLNKREAIERIKCFNLIATDFFRLGVKHKCALSMNNLALFEEMEQESKSSDRRNYLVALQYYMEASGLGRDVCFYSAMKVAQILAEMKAGINAEGEACAISEADKMKTITKCIKMMELAGHSKDRWGSIHFYRGEMIMNYLHDGIRELAEEDADKKAFDEFVLASASSKKENKKRQMPLILKLIETGLKILRTGMSGGKEIKGHIQSALDEFRDGLSELIVKTQGERKRENWTPSHYIVEEYMDQMMSIEKEYKKEIEELSLSDQMDKCVMFLMEQRSSLESWKEDVYPNYVYSEIYGT